MRNIAVITGSRAEYGLLKNIMKAIDKDKELNLQLIVTGSHLSSKFGLTVNEIINDGFNIAMESPILIDENSIDRVALEMSIAIKQYAKAFKILKPTILLILGDRYEALAATVTAMTMNIPIAHLSGGEITEGAMDEQIRHSITKLAHIHFPGAKAYGENIIKMGEEPWRVFNVGDPAIENIKLTKFLDREELIETLGFVMDKNTLLVTFHPVTLELDNTKDYINNLISALKRIDKKIIITYPNSDNGGDIIIQALENFSNENSRVHLYKSLGSSKYLSVMNLCEMIIGNSSSAIVEGSFLKKPVVNIGSRQKGRLMAENIIQVNPDEEDIYKGIIRASTEEFKVICSKCHSLYGEGNTSEEVVRVLKEIRIDEKLLKKKLYWSE